MHRAPHQRLRELREKKGFVSQKQFAAHAQRAGYEIGVRRYGAIERGDVRPNINEIAEICLAMNISADTWLMGRFALEDSVWLTDQEMAIVTALMDGLLGLRS